MSNMKAFGPTHANVATAHYNIATLHSRLGHLAEARRDLERALAAIDAGGQPSPLRWPVQARLALVLYDDDRDAGLAALHRDLAACETVTDRAACRASMHFAQAKIAWERGDQAGARALAEGAALQIGSIERSELQKWLRTHSAAPPSQRR